MNYTNIKFKNWLKASLAALGMAIIFTIINEIVKWDLAFFAGWISCVTLYTILFKNNENKNNKRATSDIIR